MVLLTMGLALALALPLTPSRYELRAGDPAPRTIKSSRDVPPFVSEILTNERKQRAAASVGEVLQYDAGAAARRVLQAQTVLEKLQQVRDAADRTLDERLQTLSTLVDPPLDPEVSQTLLRLDPDQWKVAQGEVLRLLREGYEARIAPRQLDFARAELRNRVQVDLSADQTLVARALAPPLLQPNLIIDPVETERARQLVMEQVEPVSHGLLKGETIVRDGQIVTGPDLEKLQAAGLLGASVPWQELAGTALLATVLSIVLGLYLFRVPSTLLSSPRRLLLLGLVVVGTVLAAKLAIPGRPLWAYLFPLAAGPMLVATLLDASLAIVVAGVVSLPVGYLSGFAPELTVFLSTSGLETLEKVAFYFSGSIAGILGVTRARRIHSFFVAGGAVSAVGAATVSSFWLLTPDHAVSNWGFAALAALGNGLLAAALTVGTFVVLGHLFGITTSIQLLELAQPDQPLLRRLLVEAPGTYYHSLLVGNLAERAAEVVDADPLLARVGAYYHDIGKIANPGFFIENQRTGGNPHDRLSPADSAAVITAHVHDGMRLAHEYRLPVKIQDFICEHHGTRLATYFYHRAVEQAPDPASVDRRAFGYPGPRPQSKETAVVMLADSVEAATRSLQQPTPEDIDAMVERIVAERIAEGQLDDSQLTFRDVHRVRAAFKEALRGIFHPRIAYPSSTYAPEPEAAPAPGTEESPAVSREDEHGPRPRGGRIPFSGILGRRPPTP